MPEKANRNGGKAKRLSTRKFSEVVDSASVLTAPIPDESVRTNNLNPPNDNGKPAEAAKPKKTRARKKRNSIARYFLKNIGLIIAIVTIPLAYWQGTIQSSHGQFERNQRVVELSISLASFWETQFDTETRSRVGRYINKLKSLKTDEEKRSLANSLADSSNLRDSDVIIQNKFLYELIEPDLGTGSDGLKITPVMAAFKYRAALIRTLNTMEVIAIVKEHSQELPEALKVLDSAYSGTIQQKYKDLTLFVEEYHKTNKEGRRKQAWEPLINMVEEEDRKMKQAVTEGQP